MPVGLQCFNESGSIQLTTEDANLYLVSSGAASTVTSTFAGQAQPTHSQAIVTVTGRANPILAIRCASYACVTASYDNGGGSFTFAIHVLAAPGATINWYCFDTGSVPAENIGLETYDSSGVRLYSTSSKLMRMRAALGAATYAASATGDFTYDSGRLYATALSRFNGQFQVSYVDEPGPGYDWTRNQTYRSLFTRDFSSGISLAKSNISSINSTGLGAHGPATLVAYQPCFVPVIDVTGY